MASNQTEQAGSAGGTPGTVDSSGWRYLADMELPPDMQQVVAEIFHRYRARSKAERRPLEEAIKLQHFFGRQHVATMLTPRGTVIVCVGDYTSDEFGAVLDALPPDVRCQILIESPPKWNE